LLVSLFWVMNIPRNRFWCSFFKSIRILWWKRETKETGRGTQRTGGPRGRGCWGHHDMTCGPDLGAQLIFLTGSWYSQTWNILKHLETLLKDHEKVMKWLWKKHWKALNTSNPLRSLKHP
jgi:hypothetical protein